MRRPRDAAPPTHVIIPDTQIKPGVDTAHIEWIGRYIAEALGDRPNVQLVVMGDWWDMPSLSSYDRGTRRAENRRIADDIAAGNQAFRVLDDLVPHRKTWGYHFLFGNHEDRITRAVDEDAATEGLLSLDLLDTRKWERHPYLEVVDLDGVLYSHYFYNPMSGRPYGGQNLELRLKTIGHSFTMGHQQGLLYAVRSTVRGMQHGLVAGSCYLHDEEYRGPQANLHWRGIVVANQVEGGTYDPTFVSLDYLARRFAGKRLAEYLAAA